MHRWGDAEVDWDGIEASASEIAEFLARWGRLTIRDHKEKFGTVRVYVSFGAHSLLTLLYPFRHSYKGWPDWLVRLDLHFFHWLLPKLNPILIPHQRRIYRLAYQRALRKRPHLTREILSCADYPELLDSLKKPKRDP